MARKPNDQVKLNLRFAEVLRSRLEKRAIKNNRSLNEEIVRTLEESFARENLMETLETLADSIVAKIGATVTVEEDGRVILKRGSET